MALAGQLTPKAWTDREGTARPSLDLVAQQVLTAYHAKRRREAMQPRPQASNSEPDGFGNAGHWPEA